MQNWKLTGIVILLIAISSITALFALDTQDKIVPKITYISSTEYVSGDSGQTIIRLTDFKGIALIAASCYDTILYPNKTIFQLNASMSIDAQGNYYDIFTIPSQDGVYETTVVCELSNKEYSNSKTFHVSLLSEQLQARLSDINMTLNNVTIFYFLGGTEYHPGNQGMIVTQFLKGSNPLDNRSVTVKVLYPDMSICIASTPMIFKEDGIYYYNFTIPSTIGVYTALAQVTEGGQTYYASHTFHVNKGLKALVVK
jgi:hypothetical protein